MISSGTEQGRRFDRRRPRDMANISSSSHPRFRPARWWTLGGMVLALLLSRATPADAVTIDSQTASPAANTNDNGAGSLLNAPDGDAITLQIRALDPRDNGRFGLTSGHLSIDKNVTLSDPSTILLLAKRIRGASPNSIVHVDSEHMVAIDDLTAGENLALPVQLVILTAGGIAMLFMSLALSYRQLQRPRGKRVRFGILWHAFKPICGKCGGLLSVLNDYSFECASCRVELGARGENGKTLSPREALVQIRLKENW